MKRKKFWNKVMNISENSDNFQMSDKNAKFVEKMLCKITNKSIEELELIAKIYNPKLVKKEITNLNGKKE